MLLKPNIPTVSVIFFLQMVGIKISNVLLLTDKLLLPKKTTQQQIINHILA